MIRIIAFALLVLAVVASFVSIVQAELAVRDARSQNRLAREGWKRLAWGGRYFTLLLEPRAFAGLAAARRRRAMTAALLFAALWLCAWALRGFGP